jgi:uncharacterized protein (DUF736 family)
MIDVADIGVLKEDGDGFSGRIRTLRFNLRVELHPNEDRRGDGSPDFVVYAREGDDLVAIGGAWKKTVESQGPNRGNKFLSLTLDDPSFPSALNCAAFPGGEGLPWSVVWNRPRQQREAA